MAQETQRFRRYGGNLSMDELIKDCRSLETEVMTLQDTIKLLEARLKALEDSKGS